MRREFLPRTEPYRQSKLYANCQSSLTIVVLTEMRISVIINPYVVPNLYELHSSVEHKRYFEEHSSPNYIGATWIQLYGQKKFFKYFILCSTEQRISYSFETIWGSLNYDRTFIFGRISISDISLQKQNRKICFNVQMFKQKEKKM